MVYLCLFIVCICKKSIPKRTRQICQRSPNFNINININIKVNEQSKFFLIKRGFGVKLEPKSSQGWHDEREAVPRVVFGSFFKEFIKRTQEASDLK